MGGDAGPDSVPDSAPPAPPTTDAGAMSDADAGTEPPVCPMPSAPSCANAIAADRAIQDTFTKPCDPEAFRQCGGVNRGVVVTYPMICREGRWRLAGYWSGVQWVALYECSQGCGAAGKLCDP